MLMQAFQGMQGGVIPYNPSGASPIGNAAGSLGNAGAGLGSMLLMQQMFGQGAQGAGKQAGYPVT